MSGSYTLPISTVFLMMGHGCNFRCKYCLQHPLVHSCVGTEVSDTLIDFIKDRARENPSPLQLQFFGGEPLVYFSTIQEIVEKCRPVRDKLYFSTITNGSLLSEEMVDFFNDNGFNVTVSWDGRHSDVTRGQDVFADPAFKARFMRLKCAGLSGVVSSYSYPWEMCEDFSRVDAEYLAANGYRLNGLNFDLIMDTGLTENRELLDMDYERVTADAVKMCREYAKYMDGLPHENTARIIVQSCINAAANSVNTEMTFWRCCCGNGYSTLNADMQGNLYYCHNSSESYGRVTDPLWKLLRKVIARDPTRLNEAECSKCPVQAVCANGCPLITKQAREETYCKLKRAFYYPVIDFLLQVGKILSDTKEGEVHAV